MGVMNNNTKMTKEQALCKGIDILLEMEKNIYLSGRLWGELGKVIENMDFDVNISPPCKPQQPDPIEGESHDYLVGNLAKIGAVAGVFLGFFSGCASAGDGIFGTILGGFDAICYAFVGFFVGGIVGGIIGLIAMLVAQASDSSEVKVANEMQMKEYEKKCEKYEIECQKYHFALLEEKKRIAKKRKKKEALDELRKKISDDYFRSKKRLEEMYDIMGIDMRFRNIVPIGYMQEFSELGISRQLEGTNGLYYLIMQELRWDQMQYTLEEISTKLSKIINQNRKIYSVLCSIEGEVTSVKKTISKIEKNTYEQTEMLNEINKNEIVNKQYNSKILAEEQFRNRMMIISQYLNS